MMNIAGPDEGNPKPGWRSAAACRAVEDWQVFYPQGRVKRIRLCDRCPVAEICLVYALASEAEFGYRYGWWAGTSAEKRDRIAADLPAEVDLVAWYQELAGNWQEISGLASPARASMSSAA